MIADIEFFPRAIPAKWDAIEMNPCHILDDGTGTWVEQCEPAEGDTPDMWSVYLHDAEIGGVSCIADFQTEKQAKGFVDMLETLLIKRVIGQLDI